MNISDKSLIDMAKKAALMSYSPYSKFCVGAALLCKNGKVFTGFNIENKSYGATNCAERTAVFNALSAGEKEFEAIAVIGFFKNNENKFDFCPPCGICRQVLSEFCDKDFKIILSNSIGQIKEYTLNELLPCSFELYD